MKHVTNVVAGLLCVAASSAAFGQKKLDTIPVKESDKAGGVSMPSLLSYTYANLGYTRTEFDTDIGDLKADGFGVSGSFLLPANLVPMLPSLYATAGYSMIETDEKDANGDALEITDYRLGAGYRLGLSSAFDLNAEVDYLRRELSLGEDDDSGSGFRLGFGGRYAVMPQIEAGGAVRYIDDGEDTATVFELNGLYHIAYGFSAFIGASTSSDETGFGAGARYNFGF